MRGGHVTRMDVLFLAISFFAIVALWIASNLYHEWVTTTITEDLQMQIIPIQAKFDTTTIDRLKTRNKTIPLFELDATTTSSEAADQTPEFVPIENESNQELDTLLDSEVITAPTPSAEEVPLEQPEL